jgi:hypothetical protein
MKNDLTLAAKAARGIDAAGYTGDQNGPAIDMQGFESAVLAITMGTAADGTVTFGVEESDNGSTGWTDVSGASVVLTGTGDADDDSAQFATVRADGVKRYIRVTSDHSASNAADYGVVALLIRGASSGEVATADAPAFSV